MPVKDDSHIISKIDIFHSTKCKEIYTTHHSIRACFGVKDFALSPEPNGGANILAHQIRISMVLPWDRKSYPTQAILPRTSSNVIM